VVRRCCEVSWRRVCCICRRVCARVQAVVPSKACETLRVKLGARLPARGIIAAACSRFVFVFVFVFHVLRAPATMGADIEKDEAWGEEGALEFKVATAGVRASARVRVIVGRAG
jgi:hypothetical protein